MKAVPRAYLPLGGTITLYVVPAAGGNPLPVLQWIVTNPNILRQSGTEANVFTARNEGLVTVTPTGAAGVPMPGPLSLTVTPGTPVSFTVDALNAANTSSRTLAVKNTLTLAATGSYRTPSGAVNLPIPAGVTWNKTGGTGSVTIAGNLLTATGAGPVVITGMDPIFPGSANPQTLTIMVTDAVVSVPSFAEAPTAGNSYVKIQANQGDRVLIYQLDAALHPAGSAKPCDPADLAQGKILPIITTGTTTADFQVLPQTPGPYTLAVGQTLTPGTTLCIVKAGDVPVYSALANVADPNDFGRVRTYLSVGVQISNQLPLAAGGSSQASTAGEYLETGIAYSFFRAGARTDIKPDGTDVKCLHKLCHPGFQGLFDVQLSPTPVSAPVTTPSTGTSTTPTVSSLNLLSSQQSVKVVGELFVPLRVASWQNGYNVTTIAPMGKVGFSTLLNPTSTSTSPAGALQTTQFSSTYSMVGFGGRLAWDQYPRSTDKAPRMVTQLDVMLAKFSDLPSYSCTNDAGKGVAPTMKSDGSFSFPTACGIGALAKLPKASRTLAYRLDIEGLARLPNLPFILGVRANLAQYGLATPTNLDYLNKPGNDIRIFIGLTLPLSSLGALITTGTVK